MRHKCMNNLIKKICLLLLEILIFGVLISWQSIKYNSLIFNLLYTDRNTDCYVINLPTYITNYLGSNEIDYFISSAYSLEKLFPKLANIPDDQYKKHITYNIYDSDPHSGVRHDDITGWKSKYKVEACYDISKSYIANNNLDIARIAKEATVHSPQTAEVNTMLSYMLLIVSSIFAMTIITIISDLIKYMKSRKYKHRTF